MHRDILRASVVGVLLVACGAAQAQSRSSFNLADFASGLTLQNVSEDTYTVTLTGSPTLTYLGVTYPITDVFGFWALSDDEGDFGNTSDFGVWNAHENLAGSGGITGWKTNPNSGIEPSQSQMFKFDSLVEDKVDHWGYHIRVSGNLPGGGNTAYFIVPSPGALALAGIGGLIAIRRKR